MNPLLASMLMQGGGALIGGMFARRQQRQEERRRRELMRLASPEYLMDLRNKFYSQALSSPAFAAAQRGIFNNTSSMTNRLAGSFAARGLSNSGVGAIAPALAGSAAAGQLGHLRTNLYGMAGSEAQMAQDRMLHTGEFLGPEPNYIGQALGGSLSDMAELYSNYYKPKAK